MSYMDYLNQERIPHNWCMGCGHGLALKSVAMACDTLKIDRLGTVAVSGIGCWSRADGFLNFNSLHTTHGRALAFATGIKTANPALNVIVATGDGCCATIGGNHLIHAARRNLDITVIVSNNFNYGTTGGQYSSTTPTGGITKTSPLGHIERPLDVCKLSAAAGATFVARGICDDVLGNAKLITSGIAHKGFSIIEILSPCTMQYGRLNGMPRLSQGVKYLYKNSYPVTSEGKLSEEEKAGKLAVGKLVEIDNVDDYSTSYAKINKNALRKE